MAVHERKADELQTAVRLFVCVCVCDILGVVGGHPSGVLFLLLFGWPD